MEKPLNQRLSDLSNKINETSKIADQYISFVNKVLNHHEEQKRYIEELNKYVNVADTNVKNVLDKLTTNMHSLEEFLKTLRT